MAEPSAPTSPSPDGRRDALDVLRADHEAIGRLLAQVEATDPGLPRPVFEELVTQLSVHTAIEKELVYPTVASASDEGARLAKEAGHEHASVSMGLLRLESVPFDGGEQWRTELRQVVHEVRQHIAKEEAELFPVLADALPGDLLVQLGERLVAARRHAPTHPHPHAPRAGLGAKVADRVTGPLDRLRDKVGRHR